MKAKKKIFQKKKLWIAFGLVTGIVMVSGGIYFLQEKSAGKASAEEMPVQETQAKTGTISNNIVGTGNLEHQEGETVTIPTGIIVEGVKVESGDQVSKGDVLATVNQTSVLRAIEEIQEQMEALDEEINESKEATATQSVKAKVDGRVKKIYVQQGQEAAECMVEQGALLLLSIDGSLAVEFETNAEITKDDSVTIDRADGTQKEGIVEGFSDGKCTVLFSDSGIGMEEEVTISDSEGNVLGTGITYIHQPLAVTAASGTVEEICVSEDEAVYTGTVLFTVDQGGESLEYQEQMAERQELAQNLQKLMILSQDGAIIAESSGMIQSVNISAKSSQSSQGNTESVQISKQDSQNTQGILETVQVSRQDSGSPQGNAAVIQLSNQNIQSDTGMVKLSNQTSDLDEDPQMPSEESDLDEDPQMPSEEQGHSLSLEIMDSGQTNQNILVIETPKTGAKPQMELMAADDSYEGSISWKPKDKKFAAKTSYQAEVVLNAKEGYYFTKESVSQIKTGVLSGITVSEDGKTLAFQITYPVTKAEENDGNANHNENENQNGNNDGNENQNGNGNNDGNENGNNEGNGDNNGNGNNDGNENGNGENDGNQENNGNQEDNGNNNTNGNQGGNGSGTGLETGSGDHAQGNNGISQAENGAGNGQTQQTASSNTSGSGGGTLTSSTSSSGNAQSSSTETSSDTDDSEITAFTLAASDAMILSVNVDELDINSVSKEQQAEIVLDAIEDEVFTGTVTKVGNSASSSSGGVAKYTVEISIPKDERMKEGMNASATITVEERENVVTIPVNALQERGSRVFVYTETDSDGSLLGEKEVTTGLSDGSNVEITEGLSDGDVVYYRKIGNTSQKSGDQNFHKMEGGPGTDMGNMRQGGFPSGDSGSGMPSGGMPNGRE